MKRGGRGVPFAGKEGEVLGDPLAATAILHRLLHHSHVITVKGESYRLREERKACLLPSGDVAAARVRGTTQEDAGRATPSLRLPGSNHTPRGSRVLSPQVGNTPVA